MVIQLQVITLKCFLGISLVVEGICDNLYFHLHDVHWHNTMQEIVEAFKRQQFSFNDLVNYHTWVHQEDVLDIEEHEKMQVDLDHQWQSRFRGPENHDLSTWPSYLVNDALEDEVANGLQCFQGVETDALLQEGESFSKAYKKDAQRIFSRVQHHMHKWTKGGYIPLKTCKPKSGSSKQCCSERLLC